MPKSAGGQSGRRGAPGAKATEDASAAMQVLFGENFHAARIKYGLTQQDIEALTGIKQAYISQIEGGRQNPTLATVRSTTHRRIQPANK